MPSAFQFRDAAGRWTRSRSKTVTVWSRATGERVYGKRAEKVRKRDKPKRRRKRRRKPKLKLPVTIPRPKTIPAEIQNLPFAQFIRPVSTVGLREKIDRVYVISEYEHSKYAAVGGKVILPSLIGTLWTGREAREKPDADILWIINLQPRASMRTRVIGLFASRTGEQRKKIMKRWKAKKAKKGKKGTKGKKAKKGK